MQKIQIPKRQNLEILMQKIQTPKRQNLEILMQKIQIPKKQNQETNPEILMQKIQIPKRQNLESIMKMILIIERLKNGVQVKYLKGPMLQILKRKGKNLELLIMQIQIPKKTKRKKIIGRRKKRI